LVWDPDFESKTVLLCFLLSEDIQKRTRTIDVRDTAVGTADLALTLPKTMPEHSEIKRITGTSDTADAESVVSETLLLQIIQRPFRT
jgi:hypothetical protein